MKTQIQVTAPIATILVKADYPINIEGNQVTSIIFDRTEEERLAGAGIFSLVNKNGDFLDSWDFAQDLYEEIKNSVPRGTST